MAEKGNEEITTMWIDGKRFDIPKEMPTLNLCSKGFERPAMPLTERLYIFKEYIKAAFIVLFSKED